MAAKSLIGRFGSMGNINQTAKKEKVWKKSFVCVIIKS